MPFHLLHVCPLWIFWVYRFDDWTYTNGGIASIHDDSDNILIVGIGEIPALLNRVEFQTRHNDYNLARPSTTSSLYDLTE